MTLSQQMFEVRKVRAEVSRYLEKIEDLAGTEESRELLFRSWYAREELKRYALLLDFGMARLRDAEKEALAIKKEEDQMNAVFDDGKLCP